MKQYVVKITPNLERKLNKYISYLKNNKKSLQAAQSLFDDFLETRKALETTADLLKNPDDENLKARNLKRINFRRHNYFLLFRINGDVVEIVTMFHGLENYRDKVDQETP